MQAALERQKEPRSVCSVPRSLLSSLFFTQHSGSAASFLISLPLFTLSHSLLLLLSLPLFAFPFFWCSRSCQLLAACSSYLVRSWLLALVFSLRSPLTLLLFSVFHHFFFSFWRLLSPLSSFLLVGSALLRSGCPSAAVWKWRELMLSSWRLSLLAARQASATIFECEGHPAGCSHLMWGSALRNRWAPARDVASSFTGNLGLIQKKLIYEDPVAT